MPTGFTADVANGKTTSLRAYALTYARGMGALITMRDDPHDAPIPARFEPNTRYHDDKIAAAQAVIESLNRLTPGELEAMWRAACDRINAERAEAVQRNDAIRERYKAMLDRLRAVPHDRWPDGLYGLMEDQLHRSMDFDVDEDPLKYMPEPFATVRDWENDALRTALRDVQYHTAQRDAEIARTAERNAWLDKLWASLEGID